MPSYTLSFKCRMANLIEETAPIQAEWIEEAMARLQDSDTWYNYLLSAHEFALNDSGGEGMPMPEITEIYITLSSPNKEGRFTGTISWSTDEVEDIGILESQLEWFIGDRMCFYEINNDEEGWHCFVSPGHLTIE